MHSVRRRLREQHTGDSDNGLPLRWAFILLAAGVAAGVAGSVAGPIAAITVGATVLGVLHKVL